VNFFHVFGAQQFQHFDGAVVERPNGAQKRRLFIEHLSGVGNKGRGNAKGCGYAVSLDKSGRGHVPGRIAARFKSSPDAPGGEGRRIRFSLHQLLAGKTFDDRAGAAGIGKSVMLFGCYAGHRLKPVREMRRAFFQGPFLHGMSDNIGRFVIQRLIFVNRFH